MASRGHTLVEQSPHHPKMKGSSPFSTADIKRGNGKKLGLLCLKNFFLPLIKRGSLVRASSYKYRELEVNHSSAVSIDCDKDVFLILKTGLTGLEKGPTYPEKLWMKTMGR
jgi:hypothetical protein